MAQKRRKSQVTIKTGTTISAPMQGRKKPTKVILIPQQVVGSNVNGFIDFLRTHSVIGLAVGIVLGTQVKGLVDQLLSSFINPLLGLIVGNAGELSSNVSKFHHFGKTAVFAWGAFVYALLDFVLVLATVYVVIKLLRLDKLDKPKV